MGIGIQWISESVSVEIWGLESSVPDESARVEIWGLESSVQDEFIWNNGKVRQCEPQELEPYDEREWVRLPQL